MFVDGPVSDAVLDDGFSILFDCDYDVIDAWLVQHFDLLGQVLQSHLIADTYSDSISLSTNYQWIH